jgi:hypothetical protein
VGLQNRIRIFIPDLKNKNDDQKKIKKYFERVDFLSGALEALWRPKKKKDRNYRASKLGSVN